MDCFHTRTDERPRTEAELRASEAICSSLISISADAIVAVDERQRIILFNCGAETIFGYRADEVLSKPLEMLLPEPVRTRHHELVAAFGHGELEARRLEERERVSGRRKNGEAFPADVAIAKVDIDGRRYYVATVRDVTARAKAEEALRVANTTLHELISASPLAIVAFNPDRTIRIWNPAAERIYGWTEEEVLGKKYPVVPREREEEGRLMFDRALRGESVVGYETVRVRKDGTLINASISAAPFGRSADGARGVVALIEDITAYTKAREAERRLSAILEATTDFVGTADLAGNIMYLNVAARRMVGWEHEDLTGKSIPDLHPDDVTALLLRVGIPTAIREGSWSGETAILGRDRRRIPVSQVLLAHRDGNDRLAYLSTIIRDITERKRSEESQNFLVDASRVLSASLDERQIDDALTNLIVPRLADFCLMRVLDESGNCRRTASRHRDRTKTKLLDQAVRFPLRGSHPVGAAHVLRTGERELVPEVTDIWLRSSAESIKQYELYCALAPTSMLIVPMRARDRVIGALTCGLTQADRRYNQGDADLVQDLAGRAALAIDNARLHSEARMAVRTRDEVLRIVAHDLRNPLNTIELATDLVRETRSAEMPEEARRQLEIIRRSAKRASRLIRDLLDVALVEAGRLTIERKPVASSGLLKEVMELHGALAQEKHLQLEASVPRAAPCILADRERILQVFANLVGNAIKFTPQGGRILLAVEREENDARFSVSDTGPGISLEQQAHLFESFWQTPPSKGGGAGLGLSICKAIVEAHGGSIWLDRREGQGATVFFTIPLDRSHPTRGVEDAGEKPPDADQQNRRGNPEANP
jgi:PAS domain S-box-containing protein